MDSFKSPNGCFHRFKGRNNVQCKTVSGESGNFCQDYTDHWSDELLPALKQGFIQTDFFNEVKTEHTPALLLNSSLIIIQIFNIIKLEAYKGEKYSKGYY